jgi:hypothetical protein
MFYCWQLKYDQGMRSTLNSADITVTENLTKKLIELEVLFNGDILTMNGPILDDSENIVLKLAEELAQSRDQKNRECMQEIVGGFSSPY